MAVEKILAYLNATQDLGITYERGSRSSSTVFADTSYASKATNRYLVFNFRGRSDAERRHDVCD